MVQTTALLDCWCKLCNDVCQFYITAKQYMEEVKIEKKLKQAKIPPENILTPEETEDPFAGGQDNYTDLSLPTSNQQKLHKKEIVRSRSHTLRYPSESSGSTKSLGRNKFTPEHSKKRRSTFYLQSTSKDVTTPFVLPAIEIETLVVTNRSPTELLDLMTRVRI